MYIDQCEKLVICYVYNYGDILFKYQIELCVIFFRQSFKVVHH